MSVVNVCSSAQAFARSRYNYQTAARNCTSSCNRVCAVPVADFVPISTNMSYMRLYVPQNALGSPPLSFYDNSIDIKSHTGPKDVWWCNPRVHDVYCSWSWSNDRYQLPYHLEHGPDEPSRYWSREVYWMKEMEQAVHACGHLSLTNSMAVTLMKYVSCLLIFLPQAVL